MESKNILKGKIGLEIHGYPVTKEKLFCKCKVSRERGLRANSNICEICTGQPGAKPMLPNEEAVKKAVTIGLMLGCKINNNLVWQRKHYDWPDMPKGYQNTISGGVVGVGEGGKFMGVRIRSMHLEEDPASWEPETGRVDYNRSGLPLIEIITEPDFVSADEVKLWLKKLILHLGYLKIIDSNAGIKVDVNVSTLKSERVEVKNISSIDDIGRAIEYELERQQEEGGNIKETRRFDSVKGKTEVMRSKEEGADYRFISDPDLVDIQLDKKFILDIEKKLPESPDEKLKKFIEKNKIDKKSAEVLAKNIDIAEFYEGVVKKIDAKFALPWVTIELLRHLNYNKTSLDKVDISVEHFVSLLKLVKSGKITELQGKQILNKFYPKSFDVTKELKGKEKIDDEKELERVALDVIKENKITVEKYLDGEQNAFNYLMGQIMNKTDRRADFLIARKVLEKLLKK